MSLIIGAMEHIGPVVLLVFAGKLTTNPIFKTNVCFVIGPISKGKTHNQLDPNKQG